MAITVTGTLVRNLTVFRDFGLNAVYAEIDFRRENQNCSLSQTVYVHTVPLPNGARILDGWVRATGRTTGLYQVGLTTTLSCFVAGQSMTATQMTRFNVAGGIGAKVSLTASDVNSYQTIVVTCQNATSASTTGTIAFCVFYAVEDQI